MITVEIELSPIVELVNELNLKGCELAIIKVNKEEIKVNE